MKLAALFALAGLIFSNVSFADVLAEGVSICDSQVGTGAQAVAHDTLTVHYVGTLNDGSVFDSSVARQQPFTFRLGDGQVIKGWEEGLMGMRVGGKRTIVIPASLAYGHSSVGNIPADSVLTFAIEVLQIKKDLVTPTQCKP